MQTRQVRLDGPGVRGTQVNGALLRDLLTVLIEGSQRALRIRTQGRSTARGVLPAWIAAATDFSVQIIEGSTVLQVEGPSLFEAAPEEFRQAQLFPEIDPARPAIDYLIETLDAAVDGEDRSALYDGQLLKFLGKLDSVFAHGVDHLSFERANGTAHGPLRVVQANLRRFRVLESRIPRPQHVKVAGKLDTIRHSDRTFVLTLGEGTEPIRGIAEHCEDLQSFWGQRVVVAGTAHFTASGSIQRIEAEAPIRPASDRELSLFSVVPSPIALPIAVHELRRPQGPRSGLNAIFGKWPGEETDEQIWEALDLLS